MKNEKYLHQFRVLAEEGSFSLACIRLHLSQSALTKNIQKIEDRLNVRLFDRHPRGVKLTEYGEVLLSHVKVMEKEYLFAMQQIESLKNVKGLKLRIGAGLIWGDKLLTSVFTTFYRRFPNVEIVLRGGDISDQLPDLIQGKLDIVLGRTDYQFITSEKLICKPLVDVEYMIVAGKHHPLAGKVDVKPSDLTDYRWLLYHQTRDHYTYLTEYFSSRNLPLPSYALNTKYFDVAVNLLLEHDYLMCLPVQDKEKYTALGLATLKMETPIWQFPSGVWMRSEATEIKEMREFLQILIETYTDKTTK